MPRPNPPHVFRKNGLYYLRISIPTDLRPLVGKSELRYSLRTGYRSDASARAGYVTGHLKSLLSLLRGSSMPKLTTEKIRPLVERYVKARLEEYAAANTARMRDEISAVKGVDVPSDEEGHPFGAMLKELRRINEERKQDRNTTLIERSEIFLANEGYTDFLQAPEFSQLCVGISTAEKRFLNYFLALLNEKRDPERQLQALLDLDSYHPRLPGSTRVRKAVSSQPNPQTDPNLIPLSLSEVVAKYIEERKKSWKSSTAGEYPSVLSEFLEIVGDLNTTQLCKADLVRYKETLQKLPAGRGRKKEFRGKSILEILRMTYASKVTPKTINKHLLIVSGLLRWAVDSGYCSANYAKGLQIRLPKGNPRDARGIWTKPDLEILFAKGTYPLNKSAHMFWLPILGLLTGARIDELSQLRPSDIRMTDGLWCIHINSEGDKRVKTHFSERVIPLHPFLSEKVKFQLYAKRIGSKGLERLFPELFGHKSECRKIASNNMSKFIHGKLGITNNKLTFHSLRHTLKQYLVNASVEKIMRNDLLGWQNEGVADSVYGIQTPPKILFEKAVKIIKLEVNCSHLCESHFVTGKYIK